MRKYITSRSIGEAWLLAIDEVLINGSEVKDDKGLIIELLPLVFEIINPTVHDTIIERFGDPNQIEFLRRNFEDLSPVMDWGYSYGQRLYGYNGMNQIESVINKLKTYSETKSATFTLLKQSEDINHTPCLITLDFKIRNTNLIINASFRSQDIANKMYGDALQLLSLGRNMIDKLPAHHIILILSVASAHIYVKDVARMRSIIIAART